MEPQDKQFITEQIKASSFFVVAALSPSFLISLICVALYLFTVFPDLKGQASEIVSSFLSKTKKSEDSTERVAEKK